MRLPLVKAMPPVSRLTSYPVRYLVLPIALWCFIGFFIYNARRHTSWLPITRVPSTRPAPPRMSTTSVFQPLPARVPCRGARGRLLSNSPDDDLQYGGEDIPYPVPFAGSHRDLGIDLTWMTAEGRYGPYGYGEEKETYGRSRVDWDSIDWGTLQDECHAQNAHRFPKLTPSTKLANDVRFTLVNDSIIAPAPRWHEFPNTRRTALVIRAFEGFNYKPEDMWMIRSVITEAALKTGGEYVVSLLVNIQDKGREIFKSQENYDKAFKDANIPPELQSIAILWDDNMLEDWYSLIGEHRTMWQVTQPLQLFALHYPEYDHYWQLELDQRFLGDAGKYLDAVSAFARNEPRKQSFERATFSFSEEVSGSYANFTRAVDIANDGRSRAWGPMTIPDISPIGPEPLFKDPEEDDFLWGVGEDADSLVTGFCADIRTSEWVFKDWIHGFLKGTRTPRWWCPPAIMRGSRSLLLAVHEAQHERGLSVPSEAMLPTFALWHGLKLSNPPQPAYMHVWQPSSEFRDETVRNRSEWREPRQKPWFGYEPGEASDGMGHGDPQSFADRGHTWWWTSNYPRRIMDVWLHGEVDAEDMPSMLAVRDGKVYAPNMAMHPVKT